MTNTQVHVESITFASWLSGNGRTEYLDIIVTIFDEYGSPAEGVTVEGGLQVPGGDLIQFSGVTDMNGEVVFTYTYKPNKLLPEGTYTFTVTDLAGMGFEYNPSANVETADSWVK